MGQVGRMVIACLWAVTGCTMHDDPDRKLLRERLAILSAGTVGCPVSAITIIDWVIHNGTLGYWQLSCAGRRWVCTRDGTGGAFSGTPATVCEPVGEPRPAQ